MKILPVDSNNNISSKGRISRKLGYMLTDMSNAWMMSVVEKKVKEPLVAEAYRNASSRVNCVLKNLNTIMQRFVHSGELTYEESEKTGKYRFFINSKYSDYKSLCGDMELSPKLDTLEDISKLEKFEESLLKIDPYKENSHFIIQRRAHGNMYDSEFIPDADYMFVEDKLVGKTKTQPTSEDVKHIL